MELNHCPAWVTNRCLPYVTVTSHKLGGTSKIWTYDQRRMKTLHYCCAIVPNTVQQVLFYILSIRRQWWPTHCWDSNPDLFLLKKLINCWKEPNGQTSRMLFAFALCATITLLAEASRNRTGPLSYIKVKKVAVSILKWYQRRGSNSLKNANLALKGL